jgi:hypothetical protein
MDDIEDDIESLQQQKYIGITLLVIGIIMGGIYALNINKIKNNDFILIGSGILLAASIVIGIFLSGYANDKLQMMN